MSDDDWEKQYLEDMRITSMTEDQWKQECNDKFRKETPWWFPKPIVEAFLWSADIRSWWQFLYKFPVCFIIYAGVYALAITTFPILFPLQILVCVYRAVRGHGYSKIDANKELK